MGCCGCSLSASALTAVVLGLVESIVGMSWNILVIVIIETQKALNRNDSLSMTTADFLTAETTLLPSDVEYESTIVTEGDYQNETSPWEDFKATLTSDVALKKAHLLEISIAALSVNSFWLITTLALAVGNAEKCRNMLRPWIFTAIIVTICDIAATIYFIFKAMDDTRHEENIDVLSLFVHNIFVILATLFSRGGPIIWVTNIALCIFVAQRIKEIELSKKKRLPFDSDLRITPYALQAPYESYESDSYRCEKTLRPSTPPPDYEAYQNRHGKKSNSRRQSSPSECDHSTLPVSLRSTGSRPTSAYYPYDDDRVELQQRPASGIYHYHPHHHGYDNKALQMDQTESWMGIPRPTLKISR